MKKIIGFIFIALSLVIIAGSCGEDRYAKRLKREKRAIKRVIADRDLQIINGFPADSIFKEGFYYKDSKSGIYMAILDAGTGKKARPFIQGKHSGTNVSIKMADVYSLNGNGDTISTLGGPNAMSFEYGIPDKYSSTNTGDELGYRYLSPAIAVPLRYVADGAVVSMIVPFDAGSTMQKVTYDPLFYGELRYTFTEW